MKYLMLTGLIVLCCIQWFMPLNMIQANNTILREGKVFRFETEPVDPSMPFVGKYVYLQYEISHYSAVSKDSLKYGEEIFVLLENDTAGFAKIAAITRTRPSPGSNFVKATSEYSYRKADTLFVNINFPFNRFYMDEYKAPAAETEYRRANLDSARKAFAMVSVLNGETVIKDIIIDGRPLKDWVKQQQH